VLQVGDVCELGKPPQAPPPAGSALEVPPEWRPDCDPPASENGATHVWSVRMLPGPQAAPDYFTEEDMKARCASLPFIVEIAACSRVDLADLQNLIGCCFALVSFDCASAAFATSFGPPALHLL
jgi:hypothetical protein